MRSAINIDKQKKSAMKYVNDKRKLECDMFAELSSAIQNLEPNSENSQNILTKLLETLDKVLNENLYQAKNDGISHQHREILEKITSYIISVANLGVTDNYILIFKLFNILLQIEYSVIQQHIDSLWRIILVPQVESVDSCIGLLKRLLEIYAKSHKMDLYLKSLLSVLSDIQLDTHIILRSPLFCTVILDEFSNKVANNVSTSQAIEIIALFTREIFCLPELLKQSSAIKKSSKRRKLDEKHVTDAKVIKMIEPLSLLMNRFLKVLRITVSSKDELEKEFQTMFDRFIYPILSCDYCDKDVLLYGKMAYAALSLHHVLVDISISYWKSTSTPQFMTILSNVTSKDPKSILFLNKVRLQHVYQAISLMNYQYTANDDSGIILHQLVDSVLLTLKEPENPDITWTGRLVDLNDENFAVANYTIVLGDWLDVVSNTCHENHLASIVRGIINWSVTCSSINLQHLKEISIGTLYLKHLRSAEFFELKSLRDVFVKVFFEEISKCFYHIREVEMSDESVNALDIILLIISQNQKSEKPNFMDDIVSCFNENIDTMNPKTCFSLTNINKIARYLNLLHLFPMEYFTKQEIRNLSLLTLLVDKWVSVIKAENYNEISDIIKCSILCRSLICKFISYTNKKDDILKKDASFIIWWISSISAYRKHLISCTNGLGHDDIEEIQNLFEHFMQITCQAVTLTIRQILVIFSDDAAFKTNYFNRIVDYFKNLLDGTGESFLEKRDSLNDVTWRFISEFLKLGIEFAESRKKSKVLRLDRENSVWRSFLTLQGVVEKNLNGILSGILDKSIKIIQDSNESNDSNDLKWKKKLSMDLTHYENELKTYKICLQYYHLDENSELKVIREASNIISLLLRNFKITKSMLCTGSLEMKNTFDNEVILKQCITLLSIVIDFIYIIESECSEDILLEIFKFICDLMKIFYEEDSNRELSKELGAVFNSMIPRLSNERYDIIFNNILTKLEISSFSNVKNTNEYDVIFLIHLIDVFLHNSSYEQLRRLEQKLPNLLCGICGIAEVIDKVTYGIQILRIVKFLICHRAFSFQSMDVGLALSIVTSLTSPKRHYELSEEQEFKELFEEICYLLCNILNHRREPLIHTIPTFIFIIQSMFHCFKKSQRSYKSDLKESQRKEHQGRYISWWEVHIKNPLPIESANIFTRLLTTISHTKKSSKGNNKSFVKHIPSLLSEYIYIQTKNSILETNVRDVLKNGIYSLLELCGQYERDMIMVNLDVVGKSLFKSLWTEYNKEWKYVGRG